MEGLARFSDYDVFGYLVSGIAAMATYDSIAGTHLVLVDTNWTISHAGLVIILAYVVGHMAAALATTFLDRWLVRGCVGTPANILMGKIKGGTPAWWRRCVFGDYLSPLEPGVQQRVMVRAGINRGSPEAGRNDLGEMLFWRAWPVIKRQAIPYGRMDSFLQLYGFCRNFSFVALLAAISFAGEALLRPNGELPGAVAEHTWWAVLALVVSISMFRRYLKFFRAYGVEVFSTYAESDAEPRSADLD